jgi:hypothetical protein
MAIAEKLERARWREDPHMLADDEAEQLRRDSVEWDSALVENRSDWFNWSPIMKSKTI